MEGTLGVGSIIEGRYELTGELGEGGFAKVFTAKQQHLDRLVAVKVLNVSLLQQEDESFERRFLHEARLAAQISHPNVVTIHEFGFAGPLKQPYIVMEMLQGHDLDRELYQGPMLPSRMLELMIPCLDALAAGHDLEIVHKDLKPANLFISRPGTSAERLMVLDFGVARWNLDASPKFTATGAFTGTPAYMAPEYARKQIVTPAIDVYQMGLVIAETMTGMPLVMEETPWDCLMIHTEGKVEIPKIVAESPLGAVVEKALAYDHEARPSNARQLSTLLESVDPRELDAYVLARDPALAASEEATLVGERQKVEVPAAGTVYAKADQADREADTSTPVTAEDHADTDPDPVRPDAATEVDPPREHQPSLVPKPAVRRPTPPEPEPTMTAVNPPQPDGNLALYYAAAALALLALVAVVVTQFDFDGSGEEVAAEVPANDEGAPEAEEAPQETTESDADTTPASAEDPQPKRDPEPPPEPTPTPKPREKTEKQKPDSTSKRTVRRQPSIADQ